MNEKSKINKILALVGCTLLAPAVIYAVVVLIGSVMTLAVLMDADPSEKQSLLEKTVGYLLETQFYTCILFIPGLAICAISAYIAKVSYLWFSKILRVYFYILIPCIPIVTLLAVPLFMMSIKVKENA